MKTINKQHWNRQQQFDHFMGLKDPSFAITFKVDVTNAYAFSKSRSISFFGKYLHDCLRAVNSIENFRYRIKDDDVVEYDVINASPTILRADKTFGFSFVKYDDNLNAFLENLLKEKQRVQSTKNLYPPVNGDDCIHCSALPWIPFTGHKEPVSGLVESIPEVSFSKVEEVDGNCMMNVAVRVNHALIDGYHVGQFYEKFQYFLNE
ncbi:CatA-like O-acetyltransferase [Winogradskyella sp. A3E31]|uniref:CatA-like O-acetyltransferase n=1 Tax=Winogradskyella sp. A3E31 TaxID=3349637 RepID=UPI00398B0104